MQIALRFDIAVSYIHRRKGG